MQIYLIRHGLTKWNKEGRYAGWSDVPLSADGVTQAERLARRFAILGQAALYCSDLARTRDTAAVIGQKLAVKPVSTPALREINFGAWEGCTYAALAASDPAALRRWYSDPFSNAPPGGETVEQLLRRAWAFLEALVRAAPPGEPALLVTHGGLIRALLYRCLGLEPGDFWEIRVESASVSLLEYNAGSFNVVYSNSR